MSTDPPAASAPRRRDPVATRSAILRAAGKVFTELGYDGAGVRDIARAAGVDARLIGKYFGSKEGLFAEVVDVAFEKSVMMTPELNEAAARSLLTDVDHHASDGLLLTLRSVANPRAAAIMRESIERNYQSRLADALPGTDTTARSALLIAVCAGVLLNRMLLGSTPLNAPDAERLVPYLRASLDALADTAVADTGDLDDPRSHAASRPSPSPQQPKQGGQHPG